MQYDWRNMFGLAYLLIPAFAGILNDAVRQASFDTLECDGIITCVPWLPNAISYRGNSFTAKVLAGRTDS